MKLETFIETYMPDAKQAKACTGDLLCERSGVRHKAQCPGRTVHIDTYVKRVMDA